MNHPNRKRELFDCSPAIAAKLARCNDIARCQLAKSPTLNLTEEDFDILGKGRRHGSCGSLIALRAGWKYRANLNA